MVSTISLYYFLYALRVYSSFLRMRTCVLLFMTPHGPPWQLCTEVCICIDELSNKLSQKCLDYLMVVTRHFLQQLRPFLHHYISGKLIHRPLKWSKAPFIRKHSPHYLIISPTQIMFRRSVVKSKFIPPDDVNCVGANHKLRWQSGWVRESQRFNTHST